MGMRHRLLYLQHCREESNEKSAFLGLLDNTDHCAEFKTSKIRLSLPQLLGVSMESYRNVSAFLVCRKLITSPNLIASYLARS